MKRFSTLLRRELWEHKGGLIWTPIIVAALLTVLTVTASIIASNKLDKISEHSVHVMMENGPDSSEAKAAAKAEVEGEDHGVQINGVTVKGRGKDYLAKKLANSTEDERGKVVEGILTGVKLSVDAVMMIVLFFYALACLFDERKDRSIHFWRSLPVSDTQAVLAKLFTAMFVAPAIVLAVVAVTQILWLCGMSVMVWKLSLSAWELVWAPSSVLMHWLQYAVSYVIAMLWILPFLGAAMLAGAATRKPFLWLVLPIIGTMIMEEVAFDTSKFAGWIGDRIVGLGSLLVGDFSRVIEGRSSDLPSALTQFSLSGIFGNGQFWFGIALGAAFVVLTIEARRRFSEV